MSDRGLDIVLFGGTGFVGRLVAQRFAERSPDGVRVGLAGRSGAKLSALRDELGVDWPLLVADSSDQESVGALARSARVVLSTVGPYAHRGLTLVRACATAGTSYADLTGEPGFVRDSIDAAHETARATGARIVHACGFDSLPSDLGMLELANRVIADGGGGLREATLLVTSISGGLSGGTFATLRVGIDDARADPALRRRLADPYLLSPDRAHEPDLGRQSGSFLARRLDDGTWVAPFVMNGFNSQIVRRSNALQGHRYGRRLRYREVISTGRSPVAPVVAAGLAIGTGALVAGLGNRLTRPVLDRILPDPGKGPSEKTQERGHFVLEIRGTGEAGQRWICAVAASGDPGYRATSVMVSESALCLALDEPAGDGGVLTPATAMGGTLTERLRRRGFTFEARAAGAR